MKDCVSANPWALLLDALDVFPSDHFHRLVKLIPAFKEAVNVAWNATPPDRDRTRELVEEFWRLFCCHLRLDRGGHEEIPPTQFKAWHEIADERLSKWERIFRDIVLELSQANSSILGNSLLGPIAEKRRAEQRQESEAIDEGLAVIAEKRSSLDSLPEGPGPR